VIFAATVPTDPRKMLVAGVISVSMNPIGMLVAKARGMWDFGPSFNVIVMHYQDYLLVAVAVVISHVLTGLGQKVAIAREMGSYQLGELLGRGGMGEVYKATHRLLARPAAIKLIRPDASGGISQETLVRFEREAQATAALSSPHTVQVYDFGLTEDGAFYYVMELLTGLDADTLVRRHGRMPPERVVYLLLQVCKSLEEAHARDFVHRDIKPANILVCRYGLEYDFVKVLDFGLVKSRGLPEDGGLTAVGVVAGTPEYMAPEIARGERGFDHRADLYSVGCVAYRLLSGSPVFDSQSPVDFLIDQVRTTPVRPSSRAGISIPKGLEDIVMACLEKNPTLRPQSAAELARRLRDLGLDGWTAKRAEEWWRGVEFASPDPSEAPTWAVGSSVSRVVAPAD
jgi:eukaryotic-like serine/threonine-protein kinase